MYLFINSDKVIQEQLQSNQHWLLRHLLETKSEVGCVGKLLNFSCLTCVFCQFGWKYELYSIAGMHQQFLSADVLDSLDNMHA